MDHQVRPTWTIQDTTNRPANLHQPMSFDSVLFPQLPNASHTTIVAVFQTISLLHLKVQQLLLKRQRETTGVRPIDLAAAMDPYTQTPWTNVMHQPPILQLHLFVYRRWLHFFLSCERFPRSKYFLML